MNTDKIITGMKTIGSSSEQYTSLYTYAVNFLNSEITIKNIIISTLGSVICAFLIWLMIKSKDVLVSVLNQNQAKIGTISWLSYFAIRAYRSHVKQTYGTVRNIYLDRDEKLDLEQVFVPMTLILRKEKKITLVRRKETREILTDPDNRRLVILANPGSGKTTLFQALSSGVSSRQWHELDNMLPVFISLRKFSDQTDCTELYDWISQETFPFHGLKKHIELLKSLISQGRLLLLLDGLDEINEDNEHQTLMAIENFLNEWDQKKQCRVFVSCREQNFNLLKDPTIFIRLGFQEYRLSDLRDREMETLIANRRDDFEKYEKHIDRFLKDIRSHPNTLSLHRNPLLLTISIALYLHRPQEEVPHNLASFYEESIRHLLRRRDYTAKDRQNAFNERDKYYVLQQFALSYMIKRTEENKDFETFPIKLMVHIAQKAAKERINVSSDQADEMVREIHKKAGLITDIGDTIHFTFAHRSFHEYCAARLLSAYGEKGLKLLQPNILNPKWHQTAIFYVSIVSLEGNTHAEDLITHLIDQVEPKLSSDKKEILALTARCASELNRPLQQLRIRVINLLFQTIQQSPDETQELMVSMVIMGKNAPEAVRKIVEERLQQLMNLQNPQSLAKELNRMDQETALALLKFMADSNNQRHHVAALIGLIEMDCLEKIEILWTLLEKFENQRNKKASTHTRHQIFSVIEKDDEAVSYLNNLNTRCLVFIDDQDVRNAYPFCELETKQDNFARLLALEKINQTTKIPDKVHLDEKQPWKSFFHTLLKEKTASEEKQWQRLPKDRMKRIWRLQWKTLGQLFVGGVLIWGIVLLCYWVFNANLKVVHIIFLCCSSIYPAVIWPMFRFIANRMKWLSEGGVASQIFSKCLKGVQWRKPRKPSASFKKAIRMRRSRFLLRIIIFSVCCVLCPLSFWLTNPTFIGHVTDIKYVYFSQDGRTLHTHSYDNTTILKILWDAESGQVIHTEKYKSKKGARVFDNYSYARKLLISSIDDIAILRDAKSAQFINRLEEHIYSIGNSFFSPDDSKLLTVSTDNTAILWDAELRQFIHKLGEHKNSVYTVEFSPDSRKLFTCFDDTAILWDAETGKISHKLGEHKIIVNSVAFSPDSRKLLTAFDNGTAILWDVESGQVVHKLGEYKNNVNSVKFSQDGRKLVIASDNTALIWNTETGQKIWQTPTPFYGQNTWDFSDILVWFILVCLLIFFPFTRVFDKGRYLYLRKPNKYLRIYDLPGIEKWI